MSECREAHESRDVPGWPGRAPELDGLLCFDLYAASRAVTAAYRPILFELGLTYPQYLVLTVLWARGECSITYLAETLRLDHGTLSPLLKRMEQADLLTRARDSDDERIVTVRLAPGGQSMRRRQDDIQCRVTEVMGMTDREFVELQGALRALTSRLS